MFRASPLAHERDHFAVFQPAPYRPPRAVWSALFHFEAEQLPAKTLYLPELPTQPPRSPLRVDPYDRQDRCASHLRSTSEAGEHVEISFTNS